MREYNICKGVSFEEHFNGKIPVLAIFLAFYLFFNLENGYCLHRYIRKVYLKGDACDANVCLLLIQLHLPQPPTIAVLKTT